MKYAKLVEEGSLIYHLDLNSNTFLCVYTAKLSTHVVAIYPLGVSWPIDTYSDEIAIKEGKKLAKNYLNDLSCNLNPYSLYSLYKRFIQRSK